ncbi:MAG: S8 family serine peptidase [Cytophagales bacterium]|nr:S8 family serine peptidase [Cytophagales bacterium]
MRITLLIILIFLSINLAAQSPNVLNSSPLIPIANSPYLQLNKGELTSKYQVIRRLGNGEVIVRKKSAKKGGQSAGNSGINHEWKWGGFANELQEGFFYIRTAKSLSATNGIHEHWFDPDRSLSLVYGNIETLKEKVLPLPSVTFIQPANRTPKEESLQRLHNLGINGIRKTHQQYPNLNGASLIVSVKENALDTADLDLAGRASWDGLTSTVQVNHATNMATLIGGAANSGKAGEGVARATRFLSEDFSNLLPAPDQAFLNRNIALQNHSYGVGVENFYGVESVAFDQQALTLPTLLHVFSSGNLGALNSTGDYEDIVRYRTLTGSFKQAKNVLVVTGSDDLGEVADANSAGPAYDGRIKPELTAYGGSGTSDAAALVTGASLVLQELFEQLHDEYATIDLMKAILIASSKEVGAPGPDFLTGYGQMSLPRATDLIDSGHFIQDNLTTTNTSMNHTIDVPEGTAALKVVLSWIDPPANDADAYALVHDLNVRVSRAGTTWEPWVLDHRPDINLLSALAVPGNDTLNNVEMITIPSPASGSYSIAVSSSNLTTDQGFAIAYHISAADQFEWTYPTQLDAFTTGEEAFLYFDQTFSAPGTLEIRTLEGSWQSIAAIGTADQLVSYTPDLSGEVILRALFEGQEFLSDTFAIHPKIDLSVDLLCDEEMSLSWNDVGAPSYQLSRFDGSALVAVSEVQGLDTLIERSAFPGNQFTVTPLFNHVTGLSDETLNVNQQGAGCYLNRFLVSIDDQGAAQLTISLSTPEKITSLSVLRSDRQGVSVLLDVVPDQDSYIVIDPSPTPGRTIYQVMLSTSSRLEISSEEVEIFTTDDSQYILFPNPVYDGQLSLLSPTTDAIFQIVDSQARIVSNFLISAEAETFPVGELEGVYYFRIIKESEVVKTGRFVVGQ